MGIYDLIIIWWGASWLFCAINSPKEYKKLILEKQNQLWTKILLSGWWRCNFSNKNISADKYFWQNKKMLASVFHKYNNTDFLNFLDQNKIKYKLEDNGRFLLLNGNSRDLLNLLQKKVKENNTEIFLEQGVTNINKKDELFEIETKSEKFYSKNLVIATWWISFPQTGTNGFALKLAKKFEIQTINSLPALCGLETELDFSQLSGASIFGIVQSKYKNKLIYETQWQILFTHWGVSWPAILNTSAWISEYLNKNKLKISDLSLTIKTEEISKKLWKLNILNSENEIISQIKGFRPLNEAKASSGGVSLDEIKANFESKKIPNLFFIGEALDIVGETGWFNLQRAWSSGFVCGKNL